MFKCFGVYILVFAWIGVIVMAILPIVYFILAVVVFLSGEENAVAAGILIIVEACLFLIFFLI